MSERPRILRDPPEELNPELYKSHIDWEAEERLLAEKERQERRDKRKSLFKGGKRKF